MERDEHGIGACIECGEPTLKWLTRCRKHYIAFLRAPKFIRITNLHTGEFRDTAVFR